MPASSPPPPTGVLLVQLGTPEAPTPAALRTYLREFLSDPRVVDLPRWFWLPLLHLVILTFRPRKSARLYQRVWTEAGSPLLVISRRQVAALQAELGVRYRVALGMRYGRPTLEHALAELADAGCRRVLALPMFPQDSDTTVGTATEAVRSAVACRGDALQLSVLPPFANDAGYLDAVVARVAHVLAEAPADRLVISFHGIPQRYVDRGDPYADECAVTAAGLMARLEPLGLPCSVTFQSRFGPEAWLQPSTDEHVIGLLPGAKRVAVVCPGFVADCLETLDEIGHELARDFRAAGGEDLRLVPCVNDSPLFIASLAEQVRRA